MQKKKELSYFNLFINQHTDLYNISVTLEEKKKLKENYYNTTTTINNQLKKTVCAR